MKDVSKRIAKVLSFLLVVAIILVMVQSYIPMKISKESTDTLESKEAMAAAQIGQINNWMTRVDSYAARIGRRLSSGKEEQKWMFYDTTGKLKNLYCIQSGNAQAEVYNIYDLYSFSDDEGMITTYFGNRETYNHFMWILENMYISDSPDQSYAEGSMFKKLGDNGYLEGLYKEMLGELQALYNNAGVASNGYTEYLTSYHYNGKTRVAADYKYAINGRDNFIKVIQNYLLLSYAKQRNGGYGLSPLDKNGNIILDLRTYSDDYAAVKNYIGNETASKRFIHQLLYYLVNGYKKDSYNVNKYKNFEKDAYANTKIDSSKAKYSSDSNKIGPFVVYNKYGFSISLTNVSFGSKKFTSNEYKVVDANGNSINLSNATEKSEFYVEITTDFSKNATDSMNVNWNIDFGEVPDAKIFIPTSGSTTQVLVDVERTHRTKSEGWKNVIPDLKADIALKKYIYSVNGNKVNDRLGSIDLTNLKENKTPHNASYNMNKTAVSVNVGDTVTYAIRLFNEGEIDGTASKITDHLPNYLNFVKAYSVDGTELEVEKTNYNKDITITTKLDKMKAFSKDDTEESFKSKSQVIYVECTVDSNTTNQKVYTNIAEIAEYTFAAGSDIDSKANNWTISTADRSKDEWIDYSNNQDNWLDDNMHPFVGQEDDDDFDKIKVNKIDLALTKRIEGKIKEDGSEEYLVSEDSSVEKTKLEISGYDDIKKGVKHDLKYNMNKKPAIVSRGDKLINVITVYNEGLIDGVVKQVTDYLPKGLNFNEEETKKLNDSSVTYSYDTSSKRLVIKLNGDTGVSLKSLNSFENDVDKFEIRIVTDVDQGANGTIYNSAQITDYGYVGNNGEYYKADVPNVDIDSDGSTSGDVVVNKHISSYMAADAAKEDLTGINKDYMQNEDDDDVDAVKVIYNPEFDLALRKYIYKVEKDFKWSDGSNYTITYNERVPSLNERSVTALSKDGTAEYYHDKLKVNVETGDIVTYRIRVYNEGTGDAYDGRATQVTDYLPAGVEYLGLESGYEKEWKATVNGQVITLDYIGDSIIEANSIAKMAAPHRGKNDYYQEIGLVCKVTANTELNGKALTNRAAITEDEAFDNGTLVKDVHDKDSNPDELTNPNLDTWYDNTVTNEDTPDEYYPGEEDDDDFDTIYVYNYELNITKTDGENKLPGVDLKVMKYRSITYPVQVSKSTELTELEAAVKEDGDGSYTSVAPALELQNDVYVVKEIKTVNGYNNPFEGKYIKFSVKGGENKVSINSRNVNSKAVYFEIYNDNGDEDYTNDTLIEYNSEDENSIYNYVQYTPSADNKIDITIKNTEEIKPEGKFNVNLYKVDEEGKLITDYSAKFEGTRHNGKINIKNIDVKTENGVATIDKDVEITDVNDHYQYQIKETEAPEGFEKELKLLVLNVDFKQVDKKYVIDTEKTTFNLGSDVLAKSEKDGFQGENDASWYIDEETATINIYLKNKEEVKPEGKFNVNLYKVDEEGKLITDYSARFEGTRHNGKINIGYIDVKTKDGVATIDENVEIEDVKDHYQYQIKETEAPEGYEKELRLLVLNVDFKQVDNKYVLDTEKTTFNLGSDEISLSEKDGEYIGENSAAWFIDEETATISIYLKNKPKVRSSGDFSVKLYKVDEKGNLITNYSAKFEGMRHNGKINVKNIKVETVNGIATIDENVVIEDINDSYKYMINETEAPVGFKKVLETLVLAMNFKEVGTKRIIDTENTVFNFGSTVVAPSSEAGVFDNNETASWFIDEETATINIYLKNERDSRTFNLNLVKRKDVDNNNDGTNDPLAGAEFKITIDDGKGNVVTKEGLTTDKNGRIPTISDIAIEDENVTYTVTVEETKAPEGYIGLDKPVTFTAKSTIKDNVYVLEPVEMSALENEARISREIKADEIYIEAENRAVPVIHKGVKTVENQNSGYDKNEIQTWVINTTVPYGIKDYTKYVVTDTIDYEKSKVEEKRIEFINEDKPEENVVVKYKGTDTVLEEGKDYYVFFDKDTKVLVVTFINNDFEGGKSLKEGTKLEITFKTKFTLDADGNIIGLNQSIPNTSHLTYGVSGKEETAKSETPEVHTGGVGVFKYDEVSGKALEGAHFKIARSEEDARNGKFIKLRAEDGNETDEDYEVVSDANGHAEFVGLEFGEDAEGKVEMSNGIYTYDWKKVSTTYYIVETEAPEEYNKITDVVPAVVKAENYDNIDLTKYVEIGNRPKEYDLALRKYITNVKAYDHDGNVIDRNITDREPRVTITDEFKNKEVTTAIYEHTKEPVIVQQGNIVTYNIRVYNEGPEDAYASLVKDDIPEGTEFVAYTEGDGSINDKYNWKLLDADGNETSEISNAKYIITDYLAGGEENLIKAFDPDTMNELDFRTLQVQFRVTEPNTSERILTNYAQISEMTNAKGKVVTDRDSKPDEWNEGEDDQDIENIKLLYFDLALRKWVTKAIVYENGQEVVYETGHHAEDDPEDVVKVDLKKSKLSSIVVKFEYQIRVTNEGKIGGSATEVTDHIPEGLVFDEADNTIWTKVDDNTIVTDALKDTYLEPGESAEVTVVLRWVNSASNLGIKNNIAEISKDYNEYGVADIDSTPGNYKWGEDDIDDAPVMLAIKTGSIATQCVALGVAVLFILVFGVKGIKKSFKEI